MTKALGFRADHKAPRYALITNDGGTLCFENREAENRLLYPAERKTPAERLEWLYQEFARVFREHPDIDRVVIKTSEYGLTDRSSSREGSYAEAVLLLLCAMKQVPVETKIYRSLGTKSGEVRATAEELVGRTENYWDNKMADAVVAGAKGVET